jgi:hypothetical protein
LTDWLTDNPQISGFEDLDTDLVLGSYEGIIGSMRFIVRGVKTEPSNKDGAARGGCGNGAIVGEMVIKHSNNHQLM